MVYPWLAPIYNLPAETLEWIAIVSIVYSGFGILTIYKYIPRKISVPVLALMNAVWGIICLSIIYYYCDSIHGLAIGHFAFEAVFVFVLAILEFKNRKLLLA